MSEEVRIITADNTNWNWIKVTRGKVIVRDYGACFVSGNTHVTVEAHGDARISGHASAIVKAGGSAHVRDCASAIVKRGGYAEAASSARVTAKRGARVWIWSPDAQVRYEPGAIIKGPYAYVAVPLAA